MIVDHENASGHMSLAFEVRVLARMTPPANEKWPRGGPVWARAMAHLDDHIEESSFAGASNSTAEIPGGSSATHDNAGSYSILSSGTEQPRRRGRGVA